MSRAKQPKKSRKATIPEETDIQYLLTDSRSLTFPSNTAFFALRTETGDGHHYIDSLYQNGVRFFVVEQTPAQTQELYPDAYFKQVEDTLAELQRFGLLARQQLNAEVVAITGSNGKTTVKEFIYQVLTAAGISADRSPRSYNSQIGVPLSLWQMQENADAVIVEAGISKLGEMAKLQKIILPHVVVMTNIGPAHQENFRSLIQKAEEKVTLAKEADILIYNSDDATLRKLIQRHNEDFKQKELHSFGLNPKHHPSFLGEVITQENQVPQLKVSHNGTTQFFPLLSTDQATVSNTLASVATVGTLYPELLNKPSLWSHLTPVEMRLEVFSGLYNTTVIDDAYNNDPSALAIALQQLKRRSNQDQKPTCLILSDMQGMTETSEAIYQAVADIVNDANPEQLILIGLHLSREQKRFQTEATAFLSTEQFLSHFSLSQLQGHVVLLKGSRPFHFESISDALQIQHHQTILDINLSALIHNFNYYKSLLRPETKMVAMVKAFGYGSGDYELVKALEEHHCDYIAVALVDEGIKLREKGIHMPIIVMNPETAALEKMCHYHLEPEVYSFSLLNQLRSECARQGLADYPIHIKTDTGMHRLGFSPQNDLNHLIQQLKETHQLRVKSIFTHLAAADMEGEERFTLQQLQLLHQSAQKLEKELDYPILKHALNTAGISRFPEYQMDMVRLGIGLYGYPPYNDATLMATLRPVASLKSILLQIKTVPAGSTIGYGTATRVDRDTTIGIVPIGYADGIDRHLGNGALSVRLSNGTMAPTIGNICMDTLIINLTGTDGIHEGDEVVLFDEQLPLQRLSDTLGTIPYEVISTISPRVARHYYKE